MKYRVIEEWGPVNDSVIHEYDSVFDIIEHIMGYVNNMPDQKILADSDVTSVDVKWQEIDSAIKELEDEILELRARLEWVEEYNEELKYDLTNNYERKRTGPYVRDNY